LDLIIQIRLAKLCRVGFHVLIQDLRKKAFELR